jgi:hypothetical protein
MKFNKLAAGLALLAASAGASAQFEIVPAQPQAFDSVVLRMTVDSCVYDIDSIGVSARQEVLLVSAGIRNCLLPGPLRVIDVRLGTFPIGSYRVVVSRAFGDIVESPPAATIAFTVTPRPTLAIFPPPKHSLDDYSGNWVVPTELGWGLAIQHSPTDALFAQLFIYGAGGTPNWFTFQSGQWKSATRWEGQVYASSGPVYTAPVFNPAQVAIAPVGVASIEFEHGPADTFATLTYTVGNATITKRIRKFAF